MVRRISLDDVAPLVRRPILPLPLALLPPPLPVKLQVVAVVERPANMQKVHNG